MGGIGGVRNFPLGGIDRRHRQSLGEKRGSRDYVVERSTRRCNVPSGRHSSDQGPRWNADSWGMESHVATPAAGPAGQDQGRPRGLVAPTQRGRSRRMLGEVIVELGFAPRTDVEEAVRSARAGGRPTGQVLIDSGLISQAQLARALGERLGIDFVDLSIFEVDMGAVNLLLPENVRRYSAVPVGFMPDGALIVAMADPTNVMTIDEISMITGLEVRPAVAAEADILALINRLTDLDAAVQDIAEAEEEIKPDLELRESSEAAPAIKLVHAIIARAIEQGASDIHWNPEVPEMQVIFRVDGVPKHGATVPRKMANPVISRIKIMADLDISERRLSAGRPGRPDRRRPAGRHPRGHAAARSTARAS